MGLTGWMVLKHLGSTRKLQGSETGAGGPTQAMDSIRLVHLVRSGSALPFATVWPSHCQIFGGSTPILHEYLAKLRLRTQPASRLSSPWTSALTLGAALITALSLSPSSSWADQQVTNGNSPAKANLDFKVSIDKFVYLRVGTGGNLSGVDSGTGPAANGTVDTITFNVTPSIPGAPTTPSNGNNKSLPWSGAAPSFSSTASGTATLPVDVRSNAGQVKIAATTGTANCPSSAASLMAGITISTSSAAVPAPTIPNTTGTTGTQINVSTGGAGTSIAPSLLTQQSANWTFSYTHTATATTPAGSYSCEVTFTATAP